MMMIKNYMEEKFAMCPRIPAKILSKFLSIMTSTRCFWRFRAQVVRAD